MNFNYKDYEECLQYLGQADREYFEEIIKQRANIIQDISNRHQNLKLQPAIMQEHFIISEFFDPLIQKLEKSTEDSKLQNMNQFENELKKLKLNRAKVLNDIQAHPSGAKLAFNDFKGLVSATLGDNGLSFAYNSYAELQDIIKDMTKTYQEKGTPPYTFNITPEKTQYSSTSDEFKYQEIIKSVLFGAAEMGVKPDQVKIRINGVEQTPKKDEAYESCMKKATQIFEDKVKEAFPRPSI